MNRTIHYKIQASDTDLTADSITIEQYLKRRDYSRHLIIQLKKTAQGIRKNGQHARVTEQLCNGDMLDIQIPADTTSEKITAVSLPLDIIYEDADLLVINKPADMPIHPSQNNHDNTLANALAYYYKIQNIPFVFRCINRLDRNTTGLLIVAKHMLSSAVLSKMLQKREIHRTYLALSEGLIPSEGQIRAPIGRKPGSVIERCIDEIHGDSACTHFNRLAFAHDFSLVSLRLETGRTHQIRVHMAHIGHPLAGDTLYNQSDTHKIKRQALHSYRLSFLHPVTKVPLHFTAPMPVDMQKLCPSTAVF